MLQTLVTIDFGDSSITLGSDVYGARVTEGGDGTSSRVTLSMLPLKRCLGMYKDASCDNAFGFSAVAEPAMMQLPRISCLLTRNMPNPPPPTPPHPPPSPPPGFNIDPGKWASHGAFQAWTLLFLTTSLALPMGSRALQGPWGCLGVP